jgi:ribosome-binding protein aMBF1 (putative translation factor)
MTRRRTGRLPGLQPNGARLRELRVARGLSPIGLAQQISPPRNRSTINKAEAGTILISDVLASQIAIALTNAGRKAGLDKPDVAMEDILADADEDELRPTG